MILKDIFKRFLLILSSCVPGLRARIQGIGEGYIFGFGQVCGCVGAVGGDVQCGWVKVAREVDLGRKVSQQHMQCTSFLRFSLLPSNVCSSLVCPQSPSPLLAARAPSSTRRDSQQ